MQFANVAVMLRGQHLKASGLIFSDRSVGIVNELDELVLVDDAGNELDWELTDDETETIVDAAFAACPDTCED